MFPGFLGIWADSQQMYGLLRSVKAVLQGCFVLCLRLDPPVLVSSDLDNFCLAGNHGVRWTMVASPLASCCECGVDDAEPKYVRIGEPSLTSPLLLPPRDSFDVPLLFDISPARVPARVPACVPACVFGHHIIHMKDFIDGRVDTGHFWINEQTAAACHLMPLDAT